MSRDVLRKWRWSLQALSPIPLLMLTASVTTYSAREDDVSKANPTKTCDRIGLYRLHQDHEGVGRKRLSESKNDKCELLELQWVKDSTSTKAICQNHSQQVRAREEVKGPCAQEGNTNGFDPARSNFFEIQMERRDPSDSSSGGKIPRTAAGRDMNTKESVSDVSVRASSTPLSLLNNTVVVLPGLLTREECELLVNETERILDKTRHPGVKTEKWAQFFRFEEDCKVIVEKMLREDVLAFIRLRLPSAAEKLFHWSASSTSEKLCSSKDTNKPTPRGKPMDYYWDDPVVIKYTAGNRVAPHQDMRELTIVIPLQTSLKGGGTRFWLEGTSPENADVNDGVMINPPLGSGVIFNGDTTHSGSAVLAGTRFILMTSINLDEIEKQDDADDDDNIGQYHD